MSTTKSIVLGKRKQTDNDMEYVLHLSSASEAESEQIPISSQKQKRRFACGFDRCTKSYSKPSRLQEHERSHTGQRPYKCPQCSKAYLRETHLQAHARVHLPSSSRPFECTEYDCDKRFWTAQHLRVHLQVHRGEKTFQCKEPGCSESFVKNHQLRAHVAEVHCPPGTKLYPCPDESCDKSFSTAQKLKAHSKVHDENRYACLDPSCREQYPTGIFFPTWTALQRHNREAHPPTCPHVSCNGRTFSATKNLKAHLKVHEDKEMEEALLQETVEGESRPTKRRRGGEIGRDWECTAEGCDKSFKSKKALRTHNHIAHLKRRDFLCRVQGCTMSFGYKHLLRRHITRDHPDTDQEEEDEPSESEEEESSEDETVKTPDDRLWTADFITGVQYSQVARDIKCPWPTLSGKVLPHPPTCEYSFNRMYDLRRHLKALHGLDPSKPDVDLYLQNLATSK